jgi:hypothetical protein
VYGSVPLCVATTANLCSVHNFRKSFSSSFITSFVLTRWKVKFTVMTNQGDIDD